MQFLQVEVGNNISISYLQVIFRSRTSVHRAMFYNFRYHRICKLLETVSSDALKALTPHDKQEKVLYLMMANSIATSFHRHAGTQGTYSGWLES